KIKVSLTQRGIKKHLLTQATRAMEPDLIFADNQPLYKTLSTLWWGEHYTDEIQRLTREDVTEYSLSELKIRLDLVRNNFIRYQRLRDSFIDDARKLSEALNQLSPSEVLFTGDMVDVLPRFAIRELRGKRHIVYHRQFDDELFSPEDNEPYLEALAKEIALDLKKESENEEEQEDPDGQLMTDESEILAAELTEEERIEEELDNISQDWPSVSFFSLSDSHINDMKSLTTEDLQYIQNTELLGDPESVLLDGRLPLATLEFLEQSIDSDWQQLIASEDPYSLKKLFHHHDFRIALGLYYLRYLSRIIGVSSHVSPVLSLPLGTNVVTTVDIARLFQTITTGKTFQFFDHGEPNQISFIKRIEDRHGKVLYEANKKSRTVIQPVIISQLTEVLRKVVTHGTGRRAHGELYIDLNQEQKTQSAKYKIRVPAFGKTGTTNDFTTSYFAGSFPYPKEKSSTLSLSNTYSMATYVGYDIPKEMKNGRISIYGGTGALPLWTDFFKELIAVKDYHSYMDRYDIDLIESREWLIYRDDKLWQPLRVDLPRGLALGKMSDKYVEDYQPTNLAETGEEFVGDHKRSHSVLGQVFAPTPLTLEQPFPRSFLPLTAKTLSLIPYYQDNTNNDEEDEAKGAPE
ncbi:MAG: hypothetical protein OXC40_04040, partial [Proteobacteria bacterium]|nr:hypothetical protein [Pseudomonadota bacterium]